MVSSYNYLVLVREGSKPLAGFLDLGGCALISQVPRVDEYIPIRDGDLYGVVVCVGNTNDLQSVGPFFSSGWGRRIRTFKGGFKARWFAISLSPSGWRAGRDLNPRYMGCSHGACHLPTRS